MEEYVYQLVAWGLGALALFLLVLFVPFIIAIIRGHQYKWIIFVLCIFGFFGIPWIVALVWAIWPTEKSLADPVLGNPTGVGARNVGDTLGSVNFGKDRGYRAEVTRSELRDSATNVTYKGVRAMSGALYLTETPYSTDSIDEIIDPKAHAKSAWIIGRDVATCDIVCRDHTVSRQHARLTYGAGIFLLEDLGSANGTSLNNSRVLPFAPVSLSEAGIICIGCVSLHFKVR